MSPDDPHSEIERDLRAALHVAADSVRPSDQLFADRSVGRRPHRAVWGRWIAPAAVVATVVAIGVPMLVISAHSGPGTAMPADASPIVTISGGYVTAAGIRFPLPAGWTADAVAQTPTSVTVCVARVPSKTCDGVTVRIAIPDARGGITPVPDALTFEDPVLSAALEAPSLAKPLCPMLENTDPVGGRPAQHMLIGSCAPGSPQALSWYVTDGSLSISTPRGAAAAQGILIAAGIDFSGYGHAYGPQRAYITSGDPVPQTRTFEAPLSSPASSAPTSASTANATSTSSAFAGTVGGSEAPPAGAVTTATPAP